MIELDQRLLLLLNGSGNPFWDQMMWTVTATATWLPMAALLLYLIAHNNTWRRTLIVLLGVALVILLADRISSGVFKPMFHRWRPSHEPALEGLVHLVNGYGGGRYGFISSHAANTFGLTTFIALLTRSRLMLLTMTIWACLSSYSRIYLGVHYPGDILAGALFGVLVGVCCSYIYKAAERRWTSAEASTIYSTRDIRLFAAGFAATICIVTAIAGINSTLIH
ncbi:MAG: phosphatase PAP2 family protein [Bacteroidaceae bacterium]|nr:phosphatase PAP2 family protein [Bacteroidaceae bacterium]